MHTMPQILKGAAATLSTPSRAAVPTSRPTRLWIPAIASRRAASALLLAVGTFSAIGCNSTWQHWSFQEVDVALPEFSFRPPANERAGQPAEPLEIRPGGGQTVLAAAMEYRKPDAPEDAYGYTFVLVFDGVPKPGLYEITPDNGRVLVQTVWVPPRKPYYGAVGRVRIISVGKNGSIVADCALHNMVRRIQEPEYTLSGCHTFEPVRGPSRALEKAGILLTGTITTSRPAEGASK